MLNAGHAESADSDGFIAGLLRQKALDEIHGFCHKIYILTIADCQALRLLKDKNA